MKTSKHLLALLIVLIFALGVFSGCSTTTGDEEDENTTSATEATEETKATDAEETPPEDLLGEVYYIYTDSLYLDLYESETEVEDYTALDLDSLVYSGAYESVSIEDVENYYILSDGALSESSLEEIEAGDFVAVCYDEDGTKSILILKKAQQDPVIAEVTAVAEESLTVTVYEALSEDTAISDYANVDMTGYEATETTDTYELDGTETFYTAADGTLTEATVEDIAVGDMLIVYTDEDDLPVIVIYPAE